MNIRALSASLSLSMASLAAFATDYAWVGASAGEWTEPSNWSPSTGYPNGADDTAMFAPSAATAVTVASPIGVKGLVVGGSASLTVTGERIALGEGGISSTSSAAVGISNNLEIASAATPLAVTGPETLSVATPAGPLHLGGVISGEGGLAKTGSGPLYLYRENPFSGAFTADGNGVTPTGAKISSLAGNIFAEFGSGDVTIYDCGALGTSSATFEGNLTPTVAVQGLGCRLVIAKSGTVSIPNLELTGDGANIGSLCVREGCTVDFTGEINCRWRLRPFIEKSAKVNFHGNVRHSNYLTMQTVEGSEIHLHCPIYGSNIGYGKGKIYLHSTETTTLSANIFMGDAPYVCCAENTMPALINYFRYDSSMGVFDLNGYDQLVKRFAPNDASGVAGYGALTSPEDRPAKVRFAGCNTAGFKNRFTGSAGFEWDPGAEKTFTLSNAVSTTIGEFSVKSGTLMVKDSASFTRLGTLSVAEGAKFVAEAAGAACYATNVLLGSNAKLTLGKNRLLRCAYAEVDGVALPAGIYTAASGEVKIGGEGKLVVVPRGKSWKGGDAGDWSDPGNWEGGVPQAGDSVSLDKAVSVSFSGEMPRLKSLNLANGATLVLSNWTTSVNSEYVCVDYGGTISPAGPFTNEVGKSRVWIRCGELVVMHGGAIDASRKGWKGGLWTADGTPIHKLGFGPGAVDLEAKSGSSHGGRGGMGSVAYLPGATYDDPYAPVEPGSGGTCPMKWGWSNPHSGGGAIRIEATGRIVVDGEIRADGSPASPVAAVTAYSLDAAASGGSVWISCAAIGGSGIVSANGGDGGAPVYPGPLVLSNNTRPSCDLRIGYPAGGGMVKIETTDTAAQAAADIAGLRVSAAPGYFPSAVFGCDSLSTFDRYNTHAEPGTVVITDSALRKGLIGKGITGKLLDVESFEHEGDFVWSWGHVRFPVEGFRFEVTGNLTVASTNSRLEIGNVCVTNKRCAANDIWGGREVNRISVGGDFTVAEGATVEIRAAETNGLERWGAEVSVGGRMTVAGTLYASCDPVNLSAPHFSVGSLDVAATGLFSADRRGSAGGWGGTAQKANMGGTVRAHGFGAPQDAMASGGSHGGAGAIGIAMNGTPAKRGKASPATDDAYRPVEPGMGGSVDGYGEGGAGGGVIYVEADSSVNIDGTVTANGWMSGYWWWDSVTAETHQDCVAGGAGGTVYLCGDTVTGGGTISARGGDGANHSYSASGAGGGGRIALWSGNGCRMAGRHARKADVPQEGCTFAGTFDVSGGTNVFARVGHPTAERPAAFGAAGTVKYGQIVPPVGMQVIMR